METRTWKINLWSKKRLSSDTGLAIPNTKYAFHAHIDSSCIGTGPILVQEFGEGKRNVSYDSRDFDISEQKMSTIHRELCGIVSALPKKTNTIFFVRHIPFMYFVITNQ